MEIRYQKDFNKSYVVMNPEQEIPEESYCLRILLGNEIDTLLPCKEQRINGNREFFYDVTGEQSVVNAYADKKIGETQLHGMLKGFLQGVLQVQSYLLDGNSLLAKAEYMYVDSHNQALKFCYLPGYQEDICNQFRGFLEYLLPKLDHGDTRAVTLGYGVYRDSMKENFCITDIGENLYKDRQPKESEWENSQQIRRGEEDSQVLRQEAMDAFFSGEDDEVQEKEKIPWDTILISGVWTVVLLGMGALKMMGYLSFLTFPILLGIGILGLGILTLNLYLWKNHKKEDKRMPEKWLGSEVAQASIQWPGKKVVEPQQVQQFYEETCQRKEEPVLQESPLEMGDTQPLPKIAEETGGRLVSCDSKRYEDIVLTGDLTIVGKLQEAVDVVIPMATISRIHGKIRRVDQEYYLMDLNSRNGTYVNGEEIPHQENRRILPGDEISFADVSYVFQS